MGTCSQHLIILPFSPFHFTQVRQRVSAANTAPVTFLDLPTELQLLIVSYVSPHTKAMLFAASHATKRIVLTSQDLDLSLTFNPGSPAHLVTVLKLLDVPTTQPGVQQSQLNTVPPSDKEQGLGPSEVQGFKGHKAAKGTKAASATASTSLDATGTGPSGVAASSVRASDQLAGSASATGALGQAATGAGAEGGGGGGIDLLHGAPEAATTGGAAGASVTPTGRGRVCSLTLPVYQPMPQPLSSRAMEAYLPSIPMLCSGWVTDLTLKVRKQPGTFLLQVGLVQCPDNVHGVHQQTRTSMVSIT
jgi:hypothetical protein